MELSLLPLHVMITLNQYSYTENSFLKILLNYSYQNKNILIHFAKNVHVLSCMASNTLLVVIVMYDVIQYNTT